MKVSIREALWFHVLFFVVSTPVLYFAHGEMLGKGLLALTIGYNVVLPLYALARGHNEWLKLWMFLLPLSCGQVLPDWALVQIAGVLHFPDHGIWRIGGAVPAYFMGLWIMLLFPVTLISDSTRSRYITMGVLSLVLFAFWEWAAQPLQLWQPQNVRTIAGVAIYVLIPEVILGLATLHAYRNTRGSGIIQQVFSALSVNLLYTGALFIGLLLTRSLL
ncbi:DUF6989 domain-containing protein [Stenotrophobium rhamnosiphilum]|uniref:DUF6989 domain-containing protein n=1 Tax=Stenotrophobium rhamnosiphilum TaxID=2029166 RepID=A0A2T5MGH6_9GAMM|nr:hypothetical protein [Stenotrophobium rhamnosiphilum]PTU31676.1 hypothetical protein CJD38_10210 [Stenotrophobium rhamnosiphilum]